MIRNTQNPVSEEALRTHRATLSEKLLQHESTLSKTVSWTDLDQLPFWCALPDSEVQQLVIRCGVELYSPLMQQTIDGHLLKNFLALAGSTNFSTIDTQQFTDLPAPQADTLHNYVKTAGVALLLNTVGNNPCFAAVAATMPCAPMINFDLSQEQALELLTLTVEKPSTSKTNTVEVAA